MRRVLVAAVAALAFVAGAQPHAASAAVDPFYAALLRDGIAAAERGAHAEAADMLRVACFGMLDDAPQLAACLVRLALAQADAGDQDGFAQTFGRVLEGEDLVQLYSAASLPAELTGPFEARAAAWIPRVTLQSSATFAHLVSGRDEAQLAGLAPRARRARLHELMAAEPQQARWPLLLARLEREVDEPRAAHEAAERALALDSGSGEARCLRGWALVELSRFAEGAADLAGCTEIDPAYLVAELAARVRLDQWGEAEALVARMSDAHRRVPGAAGLVRQVQQATRQQSTRRPPPAAEAPPEPAEPEEPPAAAPPERLTPEDERRLAQVLSEGGRAQRTEEILASYDAASELAARYPGDRRVQHTAAELAYRASRFADAVRHFRQGGDPGDDQPLLHFYLAVALWETGDRSGAAEAMRRCEGKLRSTPFLESYRQRILGADAPTT